MKVAHGTDWLQEISWYYTLAEGCGEGLHRLIKGYPVEYDPIRDQTLVMLQLKTRPVSSVLSTTKLQREGYVHKDGNVYAIPGGHSLPDDIRTSISNLGEWWSYGYLGPTLLVIWTRIPGQLQHFDRFLRSVVRKLQEGSRKSIKTKA